MPIWKLVVLVVIILLLSTAPAWWSGAPVERPGFRYARSAVMILSMRRRLARPFGK